MYLSDPFGYDANDLNLDHFTHDIIRESLFHSKVPRSFDEHASPLHEGTRTRKVAPASKQSCLFHFFHSFILKHDRPTVELSIELMITLSGNELRAVTSAPPPDPESWAFAPENNMVFANNLASEVRQTPEEWMKKGSDAMQRSLSLF